MEPISVIIPVYNVEKYLDECLRCVTAQTYTELEIVLIDDGSDDGSPRICDEWAERDGRVKVIHQENRGVAAARNVGLSAATGELIAFIDSDDLVHKSLLKTLYDAVTEDGTDIAVCSFERFGNGDAPDLYSDVNGQRRAENARTELEKGTQISRSELWGKLYRKKVFDGVRFKEGTVYEDTAVLPYLLLNSERISILTHKLYFYRRIQSFGIMNSGISVRKLCVFGLYRDHIRLYRGLKMPIAGRSIAEALVLKTIKASLMLEGGRRGIFYRVFFESLLTVMLLPPSYLSVKYRLLYLSSVLPIGPIRRYYENSLSEYLNLSDKNNF